MVTGETAMSLERDILPELTSQVGSFVERFF